MFSSETFPRDMSRNSSSNFLFSNNSNNFKHVSAEGELFKSKDLMGGSDLFQSQSQQQQIQQSCSLARFRSAPGSFLASLLESTTDNSSSGDDSEALFSALMSNGPLDLNQKNNNQMQYSMKQEVGVETEIGPGKNGFSTAHMGYEGAVNGGGGAIVGSYSVGMESQVHVKVNNSNCSNLARQSSSPAGFFSGFGVIGEVGNYRVHNHAEANSSASGLSNHMNFSSATSPTSRFMPTIPENGTGSVVAHSSENGRLRNGNSVNSREYETSLAHDSWNDSPFNGLKRKRDGDLQMFSSFNGLENPNEEARKKSPGLVHHLSLPRTSAELADVQKFLHFQQDNSVPCQIRAKRGFATHPRSIAERMRRSRISEKMKKLQDLFPNMDKQTNTADMLDLAVEYIKDLQKQVQTLKETKAKCICSSKPKPTTPTTS